MADKKGITLAQWLPLVGLTCSAFVFNTSEFIPVGLLSDIAASFGLSEAQAGIMISVYAWGVMVLSLPLMMFASRFEFKRLLLGVLAIFAVGQFASALAPSYSLLIAARLLVACAHSIFWSVAAVMAARLVDPVHGALAISMIATGSSIAQIAGLPLGRAIGLAVGWRATFGVVGAVSVAILLYQALLFPAMPAGERFTVSRLPVLLKNSALVVLYAVTAVVTCGNFIAYSYIEPFMQQVALLPAGKITLTLTVFGASGLLASFLFGRLYDGHKFAFMGTTLIFEAVALAGVYFASRSFALVLLACAVWGVCSTGYNISFQGELINQTEADDSAVAMSIFSGLCNFGIGTGTAIGGQVVNTRGIAGVGFMGGAVALVAVLLALLGLFPAIRASELARKQR